MMRKLVVLSIFGAVLAQNEAEIQLAEDLVDEYFKTHKQLTPKMVRFAFHSCVGPAGCNGCLNINHPDNKGLEEIFMDMNSIFSKTTGFSRADLWALASARVLNFVKPGSGEKHEAVYTENREGRDSLCTQFSVCVCALFSISYSLCFESLSFQLQQQ